MFKAAIFDMDGLLVASEQHWQQAELEVSASLGLTLNQSDLEATKGIRMREVAALWYQRQSWSGPSIEEVANEVCDRVVALCRDAKALPGVIEAIGLFEEQGCQIALCSSSDRRLIDTVLRALGITQRFSCVHSAAEDQFGKPHPQPYLQVAGALGVQPHECIVLEDSFHGVIAGKAAGMKVVAVPDPRALSSEKFGCADLVLESLEDLSLPLLESVFDNQLVPAISRPRFHLAFPVHDLKEAQHFYKEILGCRQGRSNKHWIDFDLWGHQIVAHLDGKTEALSVGQSQVDGHEIPASHFGLLLHYPAWKRLGKRLEKAEVPFLMTPTTRFKGKVGEQHTLFVLDPSGNALEFKAFADDTMVFEKNGNQDVAK